MSTETSWTATYRLQLHAGFTFDDAAGVVPYLADLGVSHVYLSPVLTAVPGSMHGYDVLDHTRVDPELGGREGLERLAGACRDLGLGVVVDVVPNHMALVAPEWANAPLWEVLRDGRRAATAHWFDVDWAALDGRFGLPLLGEPLADVLAAGQLTLDTGRDDEGPAAGQPVVRYYEHTFPVAPSTVREGDDVAAVLERQHYLLASWKEPVLNYRRFFEVDGLVAVRVEESDVFERTHRLLLDLHHAGVIDGFRIDHPDGLADPEGYLAMLSRSCRPGTPIWVEKILEGQEELPRQWAVSGTTGYDANAALQAALVDPGTTRDVDAAWTGIGGAESLEEVVAGTKRAAVDDLLGPEVERLHRLAVRVLPHAEPGRLREALRELLVGVDRYRIYIRPGHTTAPGEVERLRATVEQAAAARPDLAAEVRDLGQVLTEPEAGHDPEAGRDLVVRFQQTTGPVMAKGIEDTAFYRWHRLVALNEVGADPAAPADPAALHTWAQRQATHWPRGMTTLSTHDTKRSEDVRARLVAVAGDARGWRRCTELFAAAARDRDVDPPTAHLIWQTLVGAGEEVAGDRLADYLVKAMREAKTHTNWIAVDEDYESRVLGLARDAGRDGPLLEAVREVVAGSAQAIRATVLGQKLLQLVLPGLPDTYQGCESLDLSLVDPDNRRPVDYAVLRKRLAALDAGGGPTDLAGEKLLVTSRALRLRARRPEAFGPGAGYRALDGGPHLLGVLRDDRVAALATRAPHGLAAAGGWGGATVALPPGRWRDELDGAVHEGSVHEGGVLSLATVLADRPVALLVRDGADRS
ncbi:malto-oligosyltrehalose synthase [Ornithinicoccus hortensis]|uniref:Maltooligosyl trehalose synthase n=1 Tax=Ornithinicoccus hortensis TaxID=82346 RepID=A0A542YNX9_9MICO|nr:malto-oligosyltrehalose synthase [Ornithinicoccus hortensis]TQL49806.1 maltooligosyl trehalose synthase [Ornithinicoccus hortensis]